MKRRIRNIRILQKLSIKKKPVEKEKPKETEKSKKTASQSKSVTAVKDGEIIADWTSMTKAAEALKMTRVSLKKAVSQETPIDTLDGAILKL